jgi:hypothetical protein
MPRDIDCPLTGAGKTSLEEKNPAIDLGWKTSIEARH